MRIYLAAQFARREELKTHAAALAAAGHECVSGWLGQDTPLDGRMTNHAPSDNKEFALRDWEDIRRADALVLFTEDPLVGIPRGARHVELGLALGWGKLVAIVGPRENVFHWLLPDVVVHADFQTLLDNLRQKRAFWMFLPATVHDGERNLTCEHDYLACRCPACKEAR